MEGRVGSTSLGDMDFKGLSRPVPVYEIAARPDRRLHAGRAGNGRVMKQQLTWKIIGGAAGVAAGWATRTVLRTGWRQVRGEEPPENPASPSTGWPDAILWAAGSGIALAVARLVAQRGAAGAWKSATGSYPDAVIASGKAA